MAGASPNLCSALPVYRGRSPISTGVTLKIRLKLAPGWLVGGTFPAGASAVVRTSPRPLPHCRVSES